MKTKKKTKLKSQTKLPFKIKGKESTPETYFHKTNQNCNLLFQNKPKDIKK